MIYQVTLEAARRNKKYTQKKAASLVGVSVSTIKNWEKGITLPTQRKIEKLCEVYEVPYDVIFFG